MFVKKKSSKTMERNRHCNLFIYTGCNRNTGTKLNHVYKNSKYDFF